MKNPLTFLAASFLIVSGCSNYSDNPEGTYANYNCNQLAMERSALNDEIQQATDAQSTKQVYELAMTAFALSNGDSYNARPDTSKSDALKARLDTVRHEEIRKQCNW